MSENCQKVIFQIWYVGVAIGLDNHGFETQTIQIKNQNQGF